MIFQIRISILLVLFSIGHLASAKNVEFVGRLQDIESFLAKEEGWSEKHLQKKEVQLRENSKSQALAFTSQAECGTRTCTTYLFEPTGKDRFRLIGKIDGLMELQPQAKKDHFDIKAVSSLGSEADEKVEMLYRFDGKFYQPVSTGGKSGR